MIKSISNSDQALRICAQINNVITPSDQIPTNSSFPFTIIIRHVFRCLLFLKRIWPLLNLLRSCLKLENTLSTSLSMIHYKSMATALVFETSWEALSGLGYEFSTGSAIGHKDQMLAYHEEHVLFDWLLNGLPFLIQSQDVYFSSLQQVQFLSYFIYHNKSSRTNYTFQSHYYIAGVM
ncbi:hypothetical protein ARMSODRAFT_981856 [Armillaria solidipes]|uniref:Uncharacterized protein n=1 Tax=Armillaria solidipes TaxID=1076256 RepID=A0A2H3AQ57_9AGAR|nr:hypothetical protein ARMSODRAFT_981856 [Armillaria solidipes]